MNLSTCFNVPEGVLARIVGGETVILDLQSGVYFGLDPVGTDVWQLLAGGMSLADICAALIDKYEVTPAQLESDVARLANEMQGRGLIRPKDEPARAPVRPAA